MRGEGMKITVNRLIRDEKGQALVLALILLVVGGLIVAPLLAHMGTGLITGQVYENSMYLLYAADAGVEDALWQIENEQLGSDLFGLDDPDYDQYAYCDFSSLYEWDYNLPNEVNDKDVHVTIENVWMPMGIDPPDAATARQIIEEGKVIIAGNPAMAGISQYEIKISYEPCGGIPAVKVIGIWLPPGFEYAGDCSLEGEDYYSEPDVTPHKGGCAVVWSFSPPVSLAEFPTSLTFKYSGPAEGQIPSAALSWIDTTWVDTIPGYTWDADVTIYKISSTATDPIIGKQTTVESYTATVELRKLGSAMSGDYHAIGATLMTPTETDREGKKYRDRLFKESSATLAEGDIPASAIIEAAFLYWSGWIEEGGGGQEEWSDSCSNFNDWNDGNHWSIEWLWWDREFRGRGGGSDDDRTLTLKTGVVPLGEYHDLGYEVTVSWEQRTNNRVDDDDTLYFAFSADGGSTWSENIIAFSGDNPPDSFPPYPIPNDYLTDNFIMRFFLDFNNTNEYCYIDNITISASSGSSVEDAKVNRVMFGTTDNMIQITAALDDCQVAPTPDAVEGSWSYSCYFDATDMVIAQLDPDTKSGIFTLGHVLDGSGYDLYPSEKTDYPLATPAQSHSTKYQWTYAGWSLLIIYSSPETKGHQLYLFDTFRYVGLDTQVIFEINNFLAPDDTTGSHLTYFVGEGDDHYDNDYIKVNGYKLPRPGDPYEPYPSINPQNNVFNSYSNSLDDPYLSGVDIDTFDVSSCIGPGDTSAEVILDNGEEIYNLVYIIISFRSLVTGGGIMGYLIR